MHLTACNIEDVTQRVPLLLKLLAVVAEDLISIHLLTSANVDCDSFLMRLISIQSYSFYRSCLSQ